MKHHDQLKSQLNSPHREMLKPTGKDDISAQSQPLQRTIKCSHQRLDVGAFHAREVAALAMGWGWSRVGRENVPSGVQLLKDPPVDEQVLLSLREERKHPSAAWGLQSNCQGKEHKARTISSAAAQQKRGVILPSIHPQRHTGSNGLEHQWSHLETPKSPSLYLNLAKHKAKLLLKYTERLGSELTWLCLHQPLSGLGGTMYKPCFCPERVPGEHLDLPAQRCSVTDLPGTCTDTAYVTFPLLSGGLQTCLQLSPSVTSAVSLSPCPQPTASGMLISSTTISYLQPLSP